MEGRIAELVRDVQNKLYSALGVETNRGYGHWDGIMRSDCVDLKRLGLLVQLSAFLDELH